MTTLTVDDAAVLPPPRLHLYEVRLELAERAVDIRVRAANRDHALELVLTKRRGWTFRYVRRFTPSGWTPA